MEKENRMKLNSFQVNTISSKKIPLANKLYIWSLLFEPLMYFAYASGGQTTGIPISVSRLLQIMVLISFSSRLFFWGKLYLKKQLISLHLSKYFVTYLLILISSSLFGIFLFDSYKITFNNIIIDAETEVPFLKNKYVRPFFDIFLLAYYYFYFIILAKYFINSSEAIKYFFNYFLFTFYVILFMGFIDLGYFFMSGSALITRHIGELTDVGFRFHSFIGEPRDAFVYLVYSGLVLVIYHNLYIKIRHIKLLLYIILSAIILTQSASGIIGILLGGLLAFIYLLFKGNRKVFYFFGFFAIIIFLSVISIQTSPRLVLVLDAFPTLFEDLKNRNELPSVLKVQSVNFLPFFGMYEQLINFNIKQIIFGSGFSSSAYFNMNFIGNYDEGNPHAQITRILYEGGILGTITYLIFLMKPVIKFLLTLPQSIVYNSVFLFFLLSGTSLTHRTLIPFILSGLILAYNNINHSGINR